jgi:hypothetical protein
MRISTEQVRLSREGERQGARWEGGRERGRERGREVGREGGRARARCLSLTQRGEKEKERGGRKERKRKRGGGRKERGDDRETPRTFWMLRLGALYFLVAGAGARTQSRCLVVVEGRVARQEKLPGRQGLQAGAE